MSDLDKCEKLRQKYHDTWIKEQSSIHGTSISYLSKEKKWSINYHSTEAVKIDLKLEGIILTNIISEIPDPHADTRKYRPLQGGCQLTTNQGRGTLGYFVENKKGSVQYVLTNQHVLPDGFAYQPTEGVANHIGECLYSVLNQKVDAAIGTIDKAQILPEIIGIGAINGPHTINEENLKHHKEYRVQKYGRTTELTDGNVIAINYQGTRSDGWQFSNQIVIVSNYSPSPFSLPGDSGSVVVNTHSEIVGLLWGGSSEYSVASPIKEVLEAFKVTLVK